MAKRAVQIDVPDEIRWMNGIYGASETGQTERKQAQEFPGLFGYVSADGFRWEPVSADPILTDGRFDSQNLALWDAAQKKYRAPQSSQRSPYEGLRRLPLEAYNIPYRSAHSRSHSIQRPVSE